MEPETNSVIPVWVEAVALVNRELLATTTLPNGVVIPALDGQAGALLGADPWVVGPTCVGPSPQFAPIPRYRRPMSSVLELPEWSAHEGAESA